MHILKSVKVAPVAKMFGAIYLCVGVLFMPFFLLMGAIASRMPNPSQTPILAGFGFGMALFMPILYGLMGFITGAIGAFLYNLFAKLLGGFALELEVEHVPQEQPAAPTATLA